MLVCLLPRTTTLSALLWDEALHAEITRVREKLQEAETSDEKCTKIGKQTRHTPTLTEYLIFLVISDRDE